MFLRVEIRVSYSQMRAPMGTQPPISRPPVAKGLQSGPALDHLSPFYQSLLRYESQPGNSPHRALRAGRHVSDPSLPLQCLLPCKFRAWTIRFCWLLRWTNEWNPSIFHKTIESLLLPTLAWWPERCLLSTRAWFLGSDVSCR